MMSIQDDVFDIEAHVKKQPIEIRDAWERVYTLLFLNEQKLLELEKDFGTIKSAVYIIKKIVGEEHLKRAWKVTSGERE